MNLRKFIANTIQEYLKENLESINVREILLKRVPFLKEYKVFKHPRDERRLQAQRIVYNKDKKILIDGEILIFPQYNVSSEITYYPHTVHEKTFHYFTIKNEFFVSQPEDMDDLKFKVFIILKKQVENKLSYSQEIVTAENQEIPRHELDKIINDMNGVLFKIEEFTEKNYINLF